MSNREKLASVLTEKMTYERSKTAMEVLDSFDEYIVKKGISEEGLYEITSIIKINGLLSRVKTDSNIKAEYKGKLFFLERGLFHYKNILVEMQNQNAAEDAWKEINFEQEKTSASKYPGEDMIEVSSESEVYDEQRIAQMLSDPEAFIRSLSKISRK